MKKRIYNAKVEEFLENHPYIPRQICANEHLKIYKRYYSRFDNSYFKVDNIFYAEGIEYYIVKYTDSKYGTFPLTEKTNEYLYEFMVDNNIIENINSIVNSDISYTGAEIKYWFFKNKEKISNRMYNAFYKYLVIGSKQSLDDKNTYYLYYKDGKAIIKSNRRK